MVRIGVGSSWVVTVIGVENNIWCPYRYLGRYSIRGYPRGFNIEIERSQEVESGAVVGTMGFRRHIQMAGSYRNSGEITKTVVLRETKMIATLRTKP